MTLPIYKKNKFEKMENKDVQIANNISLQDRKEIKRLISEFLRHRDARGNWVIPRKQGTELLHYFKKYVDPNVSTNIFGCGGCAKKMVEYMHKIYMIWRNQTT